MDDNARFPHRFTAYREALDEIGLPVTDAEGRPVREVITLKKCVMDFKGYPKRDSCGRPVTEDVTVMPYGNRTSTGGMKTSGDVMVADYKIACPMFITDLPSGTMLEMTDYNRTFRAKVLKQTTYNWGTNLWVDNIKN